MCSFWVSHKKHVLQTFEHSFCTRISCCVFSQQCHGLKCDNTLIHGLQLRGPARCYGHPPSPSSNQVISLLTLLPPPRALFQKWRFFGLFPFLFSTAIVPTLAPLLILWGL